MSRLLLFIIDFVSAFQRRIFVGFFVAFFGSLTVLLLLFYRGNTILVPKAGGTYIEGSVGELLPLNPWFTVTNDVNRDIVSLVFAGLLKYNPETGDIEEGLAIMDLSKDGKIYTLTLKENIEWHDSTQEDPHRVTADDIVFTFTTVQNPQFPNSLLTQNFQGVSIEKIDERTVQFRLDEPYNFFPSNLTLGLLPARAFEGVPITKLDQAIDFGFQPVGAGPYRFKNIVQTDLSMEVTLEQFTEGAHHLRRIVFRIFPDYATLLSDIRNLDGIRLVPRDTDGKPIVPSRFRTTSYTIPQYVAFFFNLSHPTLQDRNLRLGLQLGIDKQNIVNAINESLIVDTPLLEIDTSDWRYQFDPVSAQGALYESRWYFPEKIRLQRLLEQREANLAGPLRIEPIVLLDTGAVLSMTGSLADVPLDSTVHGNSVIPHPTNENWWIAALPTHGGTGSLSLGENLVKLRDPKGNTIDSFYLWRTTTGKEFRRAAEEQRLLEIFIRSRENVGSQEDRITANDLVLDNGFLRKRTAKDPFDIRTNEAGQQLSLTLLTSPSPPQYKTVAGMIADQWRQLGVSVSIDIPETRTAFEERLLKRDYDVLLFGQSLLENLDSYPYWHSSQIQKETSDKRELRLDAYNLSQYVSFEADALLEIVRETRDDVERADALAKLRDVMKRDVPAVFLYSPLYTFAWSEDILGIVFGKLSLHSDRFLTLHNWYVKQKWEFKIGRGWKDFPKWLLGLL